eukprot:GHVS01056926.1.p1 GENE.GHVS01056926.1~~GHVS01056926.1.p1  ORF type:complete len:550 (-),score=104.72 GHVS01056926.1:373-2022(-)
MRPQYRFIREVGRGASGAAQLMEDSQGTSYIMKSIQTDNMKEHQLRNAINEIKILNELRHPFIVRYRESFIENGALNIIMDFCSGGDLAKRITQQRKEVRKKFKQSEVVCWLAQAVMALSDMHKRHIMHRDLKPLNIFLDGADGRVRLGDFGISKQLDCTEGVAHTFVGTPHYMSPEVVKASKAGYGNSADIWSLGCVLYELCTFKTPYHHAHPISVLIDALLDNKPVPSIPPGYYSQELISLCDQMLQKDPKKRPTTQELLKSPLVQSGILEMLASPTFHGTTRNASPFLHPPPTAMPKQSSSKQALVPSPGDRLTDSTASSDGSENRKRDKKGSPLLKEKKEDDKEDSVICYRKLREASLDGMPENLNIDGKKKAEPKGSSEASSSSSGQKEQKDNIIDAKENIRNNKAQGSSRNSSGSRSKPTEEKCKVDERKKVVESGHDISGQTNSASTSSEDAPTVVYPAGSGKRRNALKVENAFASDDAKQHMLKPHVAASGAKAKQGSSSEKKKDAEKLKKGKEVEKEEGEMKPADRRRQNRQSDRDARKA